ncbi:5-formyltetrahydrofolate cyclo-ligase, partial [Candidatus Geothermarchaeota archaeon]
MIQSKREIRRYIWRLLEERDIAVFPRPVYGRIPNFRGADRAALRLLDIKEFVDASVVKVNPDSPQKHVRRLVLKMDKTLIMPTPRIKKGFLIVKPDNITDYEYASTIKGAFKYGRYIHP